MTTKKAFLIFANTLIPIISYALLLCLSILTWPVLLSTGNHIPGLGSSVIYLLWLGGATWGWLALAHHPDRSIIIVVVLVLAFFTPHFLTTDTFMYISYARVWTEHGLNPNAISLNLLNPADPFLGWSPHTNAVSQYGPITTFFNLPMGYLSRFIHPPKGLMIPIFGHKLILMGFHLLNYWLIKKILRQFGLTDPQIQQGAWLYILNPLVLLEGIIHAHNDMMVGSFLLLSTWAFLMKKPMGGSLWMAASVFTKLTTLVLFPAAFFETVKKYSRRTQVICVAILGGATCLLVGLLVQYSASKDRILETSNFFYTSIPWLISATLKYIGFSTWAEPTFLLNILWPLSTFLIIVSSYIIISKSKTPYAFLNAMAVATLIELSLAIPFGVQWYLIPLVTFACAIPRGPIKTGVMIYTASYLLANTCLVYSGWYQKISYAHPLIAYLPMACYFFWAGLCQRQNI